MSGRRTFGSLEVALEHFTWWPPANRSSILEALPADMIEAVYAPPSQNYIGVLLRTQRQMVSIHSGYIWGIRDTTGKISGIALPVNQLRDGNGASSGVQLRNRCPICGNELPSSGECDFPDQDRLHLDFS